ncbi:putative E3 ubiquitin-protein ligase UBR7 [Leptopilina heterotoma]|uniref:putative E3 ubiquitin-protein ligase UBR7 n=1 Tax=Leptopilina heterotoma TaxID=63436 RepID=UPI001CA970E3|nr:putative E3 ubiquitin-protein ligase UBR7 [Leptopilina heterotoma]
MNCQEENSLAEKSMEQYDDDNSVTMIDVLQEENQLEEDANAVLGPADDKNCTYSQGYIRQALYACKTCCSTGGTRAGVCLACSLHCHEGHELIELYTKRHFKCDCGNSKFANNKCSLYPVKSNLNEENKYNQNFDGVYCTCMRPYPDPEGLDNDEMLQCTICEDWYHSKHLGRCKPEENSYDEMVCDICMTKTPFLWNYAPKLSVTKNNDIDETITNEEKVEVEEVTLNKCMKPSSSSSTITSKKEEGCCFWKEGWRSSLCTCEECKMVYVENKVEFLIDKEDSVQVYEESGKIKNRESHYEMGMKALASLDHVQQVTVIEEYNNMKERLKEYLQKFADNKKVVRAEDIQEFFSEMEPPNKRQKIVVQKFCR